MSERRVRWGMIVVDLGAWVFAIAWPGWNLGLFVLGIALLMWAVYALLTET